jgi:hypothetical protein
MRWCVARQGRAMHEVKGEEERCLVANLRYPGVFLYPHSSTKLFLF